MNAAQAGLYVDQLTVTWRNGHTALRDASFSVPRGSIAALVGVNGSGKSTLFKALMGFVRVGHGEIAILGQPVNRALRQNLVAYVPQSEEVDWSFPVLVEDVVMMGRYGHMGWLRRAKPRDREIVDAALARVGMSEYRHRQIGELSGGQKKRVFLARAIAQQGQVKMCIRDRNWQGSRSEYSHAAQNHTSDRRRPGCWSRPARGEPEVLSVSALSLFFSHVMFVNTNR